MRGMVSGNYVQPSFHQSLKEGGSVVIGFDGRIAFDKVAQPFIIICSKPKVVNTNFGSYLFLTQWNSCIKRANSCMVEMCKMCNRVLYRLARFTARAEESKHAFRFWSEGGDWHLIVPPFLLKVEKTFFDGVFIFTMCSNKSRHIGK